jgi:hypothetical protein
MLAGFGVMISKKLHWDHIYTVRGLFFLISCLTVLSIYFLGYNLFLSRVIGIFSALTFIIFQPFASIAASGPQPKTPTVLFITLSLLLTGKKKWFWAGIFGSLSFLSWQPTGIFPLTTFLLAVFQPRNHRVFSTSCAFLGILIPLIGVCLYFAYYNALYDLLDGSILFNILYLDRTENTLLSHLLNPLKIVFSRYDETTVPIIIGFITVIYMFFRKRSQHASLKDMLIKDESSPIFLSLPFVTIFSVMDFQRGPDFFVFLPYVSIGFGKFLGSILNFSRHLLIRWKGLDFSRSALRLQIVGICVALLFIAQKNVPYKQKSGLKRQKQTAQAMEQRFGKDFKFLSIGTPQILVILHRTNFSKYVFIIHGIDRHIHANIPGGFDEWLNQLKAYAPDVIALGSTRGIHVQKLIHWLNSDYHEEKMGSWTILVRNSQTK